MLLPLAPIGCVPPNAMAIGDLLQNILVALGGEGPGAIINLIEYHFTCIAVGDRDNLYRTLSIAVRYNITLGQTVNTLVSQIQLQCNGRNFVPTSSSFESNRPETVLSLMTRRDCITCATSGPVGFDADANCIREYQAMYRVKFGHVNHNIFPLTACSNECRGVGQGACNPAGTTCCPFFSHVSPHLCVTSCLPNMTADASTNYICSE